MSTSQRERMAQVMDWHLAENPPVVPACLVDAVRERHQPERRYHEGSAEWSYDSSEEALRLGELECSLNEVPYFEVCAHCAYLETWRGIEADDVWVLDYRESLWPCRTAKALERAGDQS